MKTRRIKWKKRRCLTKVKLARGEEVSEGCGGGGTGPNWQERGPKTGHYDWLHEQQLEHTAAAAVTVCGRWKGGLCSDGCL